MNRCNLYLYKKNEKNIFCIDSIDIGIICFPD